jgi:hypothetical protein
MEAEEAATKKWEIPIPDHSQHYYDVADGPLPLTCQCQYYYQWCL